MRGRELKLVISVNGFCSISEAVFNNILNTLTVVNITSVIVSGEININDKAVASLCICGDITAYVTLFIAECDISNAANLIIKRFGIGVPVQDNLVFAEMLNIFAGNLVTELYNKHNISLSIKPPADTLITDNLFYSFGHTMTVVTADKNINFNFYYSNAEIRKHINDNNN